MEGERVKFGLGVCVPGFIDEAEGLGLLELDLDWRDRRDDERLRSREKKRDEQKSLKRTLRKRKICERAQVAGIAGDLCRVGLGKSNQ